MRRRRRRRQQVDMPISGGGALIADNRRFITHRAAAVPRPRPGAKVLGGLEAKARIAGLQLIHCYWWYNEQALDNAGASKGPASCKCAGHRQRGGLLQAIRAVHALLELAI